MRTLRKIKIALKRFMKMQKPEDLTYLDVIEQ